MKSLRNPERPQNVGRGITGQKGCAQNNSINFVHLSGVICQIYLPYISNKKDDESDRRLLSGIFSESPKRL